MAERAPLAFLVAFYAIFGLLDPLTRDALTQRAGSTMTREDVAIALMAVIGFCVFFIPVLKAVRAVGARGVMRAAWSSLLIGAAFVVAQTAASAALGDIVPGLVDVLISGGQAIAMALALFAFVMLFRSAFQRKWYA